MGDTATLDDVLEAMARTGFTYAQLHARLNDYLADENGDLDENIGVLGWREKLDRVVASGITYARIEYDIYDYFTP